MNKMIARRNNLGGGLHARQPRAAAREAAMQKWWNKFAERDVDLFRWHSRKQKKEFLTAGRNAYDQWKVRFERRGLLKDVNFQSSCGRSVAPALSSGKCAFAPERRLKVSMVKVNTLGRRR